MRPCDCPADVITEFVELLSSDFSRSMKQKSTLIFEEIVVSAMSRQACVRGDASRCMLLIRKVCRAPQYTRVPKQESVARSQPFDDQQIHKTVERPLEDMYRHFTNEAESI